MLLLSLLVASCYIILFLKYLASEVIIPLIQLFSRQCFIYKNNTRIPLDINRTKMSSVNEANYLGMNLDAKLKLKAHIKRKKEN